MKTTTATQYVVTINSAINPAIKTVTQETYDDSGRVFEYTEEVCERCDSTVHDGDCHCGWVGRAARRVRS